MTKKADPEVGVFEFEVRPYRSKLYFTWNRHAYDTFCEKNNLDVHESTLNGYANFTTFDSLRWGIIFLSNKKDRVALVHEIAHAALWVFDDIGQEISHEHSEPFCYTLDNIYEWCINCLNGKVE